MIKDFFYCNDSGARLQLNLGGEALFFDRDYETGSVNKYFDGSKKSIAWTNGNESINISAERANVKGYPSPDLNYVIAIYWGDDDEFNPPCNAVVYNADGSIFKKICVPGLVSEDAQKWEKYIVQNALFFEDVNWYKNKQGENVIGIRFSQPAPVYFFETREFIPVTAAFGAVLASGIQEK